METRVQAHKQHMHSICVRQACDLDCPRNLHASATPLLQRPAAIAAEASTTKLTEPKLAPRPAVSPAASRKPSTHNHSNLATRQEAACIQAAPHNSSGYRDTCTHACRAIFGTKRRPQARIHKPAGHIKMALCKSSTVP